MTLEGIIVPPVAALNKNEKNRVSEESQANLVRHVISGRVHGLFLNGNTGEFGYLTPEEKIAVVRTACETARGSGVSVYAGVTGKNKEETVENIAAMNALLEQGYSIDALIIAPLVYHSSRGLPRHVEELTRLTDLPFILYNNPYITKSILRRKNIRTHLFKEMAENDRIIAIKDSSGSFKRLKNYIKAADGNCAVLQGDETTLLDALRTGATGGVPSLANVFPELLIHLYNTFNHPDEHPEDTQAEVIRRGIVIYRNYRKTIWGIKTALVELGIIDSNRTLVPTEATEEDKKAVIKAVQYLQPSPALP